MHVRSHQIHKGVHPFPHQRKQRGLEVGEHFRRKSFLSSQQLLDAVTLLGLLEGLDCWGCVEGVGHYILHDIKLAKKTHSQNFMSKFHLKSKFYFDFK